MALLHAFKPRGDITNIPGCQLRCRAWFGSKISDLTYLYLGVLPHQAQSAFFRDTTVHDTQISDDTLIGIVARVKDKRPERAPGIASGWGNAPDDFFK